MFALAAALGTVSPAGDARARSRRDAPRTARADPQARERASYAVTGPCRKPLLDELTAGRRLEAQCEADRRKAGRAAVRFGMQFGYVASRDVDLRGLRIVVGRAVGCRTWPLRETEASVLRKPDIDAAGCRTRRMKDAIPLTVVRDDGERFEAVTTIEPDAGGRVVVSYGALDLELRAAGLGTLYDFATIEVGQGGWAGLVDLVRLREFRASWHLRWIRAGRGAPGLFAATHAEHPGADLARELQRAASPEEARPEARRPESESAPDAPAE